MDNYRRERNRRRARFPLWAVLATAGGSAASACRASAALLLLLAAPGAWAAPSAAGQIKSAVERQLREELRAEADKRDWQDLSFGYEVDAPAATLAPCKTAPRVRTLDGGDPLQARRRFELVCPGGWTVTATARVEVSLPAVHAQRTIERGQPIAADDLKLERLNVTKTPRGFYHRIEEVEGMVAKRRIRPNQALTPSLLAPAPAVRRGQRVTIVASRDGVQASTVGEALSDGAPGEVIQVRNINSDKVIDAKVLEPGVVTSTF